MLEEIVEAPAVLVGAFREILRGGNLREGGLGRPGRRARPGSPGETTIAPISLPAARGALSRKRHTIQNQNLLSFRFKENIRRN